MMLIQSTVGGVGGVAVIRSDEFGEQATGSLGRNAGCCVYSAEFGLARFKAGGNVGATAQDLHIDVQSPVGPEAEVGGQECWEVSHIVHHEKGYVLELDRFLFFHSLSGFRFFGLVLSRCGGGRSRRFLG